VTGETGAGPALERIGLVLHPRADTEDPLRRLLLWAEKEGLALQGSKVSRAKTVSRRMCHGSTRLHSLLRATP
jgi:hypothetical protein